MRGWLIAVLMLPGWVQAQALLSGTVRDSLTQQPLPFASVFLVNTTRGTTTDAQGRYALPAVPPGRYEMAATSLGYRLRRRALVVGNTPLSLHFTLLPAPQALGEVVVRAHPALATDYQRFEALFLGTSSFSRQCVVRNPAAAQVDFDASAQVLTASAPAHPLVVDNQALGYQLTFYDLHFRAVFREEQVSYTTGSQVVFRELPGTTRQQQRWAANRARAYRGSLLHFLRGARTEQLVREGFRLQRLQRMPNRQWAAADSLVRARQKAGAILRQRDLPASTWQHLLEPHVRSILYPAYLPPDSVRHPTADGRVWLRFRDLLAVTYDEERPDPDYHLPGAVSGQPHPRYQESVVRLLVAEGVELAANGVPARPLALVTEGYWSFEKIGELLPLDYVPPGPLGRP